MNGNETPLAPLAGKAANEAFAGSSPAPRTIFQFWTGHATPRQTAIFHLCFQWF